MTYLLCYRAISLRLTGYMSRRLTCLLQSCVRHWCDNRPF